jgi:hypothetical protein
MTQDVRLGAHFRSSSDRRLTPLGGKADVIGKRTQDRAPFCFGRLFTKWIPNRNPSIGVMMRLGERGQCGGSGGTNGVVFTTRGCVL